MGWAAQAPSCSQLFRCEIFPWFVRKLFLDTFSWNRLLTPNGNLQAPGQVSQRLQKQRGDSSIVLQNQKSDRSDNLCAPRLYKPRLALALHATKLV